MTERLLAAWMSASVRTTRTRFARPARSCPTGPCPRRGSAGRGLRPTEHARSGAGGRRQPASTDALLIAVATLLGFEVAYVPEAAHPVAVGTDDETLAGLAVLAGYDDDLAGTVDPVDQSSPGRPLFQSRWCAMLMTLPSGARTKNRRTPHGSVVIGLTIS